MTCKQNGTLDKLPNLQCSFRQALKVFSCFRSVFVFCFTFRFASMPLPYPLRRIIDSLNRLADAVGEHERGEQQRHDSEQVQQIPAAMSRALDAIDSVAQSQKTAHSPNPWYKDRMFLVHISAALTVVVYTTVTYLMWCTMTKTYKSTIESFRMDERAWVELEPIKPTLLTPASNGFPASFTCDIYPKNAGKTVARDIAVKAWDFAASDGFADNAEMVRNTQDRLLLNESQNPTIKNGNPVPKALAPNSTSPVPFRLTCQSPKVLASGHQWMDYLIGRVDYCDQFQIKHWLKFCFYVVNARGEIWACEHGNDEDRNDENSGERCSK